MRILTFFLFFVLTNAALALGPADGVCTIISLHPTKGELGMGTGFIFQETADEYHIMTAKHVVINYPNINHIAIFHELGYEAYVMELKTFDEERDLAILGIKKRDAKHYVFKLNPAHTPKKAEKHLAVTVSPDDAVTMKYLYYGMPTPIEKELLFYGGATKGNSGGPIINSKQEAVAVLTKVTGTGRVLGTRVPSVTQKAVPIPKVAPKATVQRSGLLMGKEPSLPWDSYQVTVPELTPLKPGKYSVPPVSPRRDASSDSLRK